MFMASATSKPTSRTSLKRGWPNRPSCSSARSARERWNRRLRSPETERLIRIQEFREHRSAETTQTALTVTEDRISATKEMAESEWEKENRSHRFQEKEEDSELSVDLEEEASAGTGSRCWPIGKVWQQINRTKPDQVRPEQLRVPDWPVRP